MEKQTSELYRLYRLAAQGDADAQYRLGMRYLNGIGTSQNIRLAYIWIGKAADKGLSIGDYSAVVPTEKEVSLIQRLADFPDVVAEAGRSYSPALIANYIYEVVKMYNQFYHDHTILGEEDPAVRSLRLELSRQSARVIRTATALLGIKVPERM